jgi:uncharacterized protein
MSLEPSFYNHATSPDGDDQVILFQKAWGSILIVSSDQADALMSGRLELLPASLIDELQDAGFIVPADFDEIGAAHSRWKESREANTLLACTIELTQSCNLGCRYCYQNTTRYDDVISPEAVENLKRYVRYVVDQAMRPIEDVSLRFIGGEPLLQKQAVLAAIDDMRRLTDQLGVRFHTQMDTNGLLLDRDVVRALGALSISITDKQDHDLMRPRLGGQGSFDQIVERIRRHSEDFNRYDTVLSIRYNANAANARHMPEVYRLVRSFGISRTEFELYATVNYGFNNPVSVLTDQEFKKLYLSLIRLKLEHGEVIRDFPKPTFAPCSAYTGWNLKVTAKGKLALCDAMTKPRGDIGELVLNPASYVETFADVMNYDPFEDEPCGTCTNVGICGGKMYCKTNVNAPDRDPCDFLKYELDEFLRFFVPAYAASPDLFDLGVM